MDFLQWYAKYFCSYLLVKLATNGFQLVWTCVSESLHSLKSQQDKKGESCQSSDNETILGEIDSTIRYFTIHNKCLLWLLIMLYLFSYMHLLT